VAVMSNTLVLDASYQPVAVISWQRAVTLLFEQKIEVIEEYEDAFIRSVTIELKMPSVVRFLKAIRGRRRAIKFSRDNVYVRDGGRCQYCNDKVSRAKATYDHVLPRAMGGHTNWSNVVICCYGCNQKKACRTPEQAHMKLLSIPVKPKKLPESLRFTFTIQKNTPDSWKQWVASVAYWGSELDQD
jgi:5-methylcytosine-specific restriction endonuclease McrA